jgi:transposase-like protein
MASEQEKQKWVARVDTWAQSGKSAKRWCREHQVVYSTFIGWRQRLSSPKQDNQPPSSPFLELQDFPEKLLGKSGIELRYCGAILRLEGQFDASLLRGCLKILRELPC